MRNDLLRRSIRGALILGLSAAGASAQAENWTDRTMLNGFMSTHYSVTDSPLYFEGTRPDNGINEDGSFYGTKLGLNITSHVNKQMTVAAQLFSAIQEDNYQTHLDWAFARFDLSDAFAVRTGKIKYPVGIVNEYVDVGVSYPWIQPPIAIYSESPSGPQATRESYTGGDVLWDTNSGDWTFGTDLFAGQVDLTGMTIKKMIGVTARADWNDAIMLQASTYTGDMAPDDPTTPMGMMMDGKSHSSTVAGVKMDWHNIVAYAESAKVKMDVKMAGMTPLNSDSWYATLGYRIMGRFLPHYTYQKWDQDDGDGEEISTIGFNYSVSPSAVVKLEYSNIKTDGTGLFVDNTGTPTAPAGDVKMTAVALDVVF